MPCKSNIGIVLYCFAFFLFISCPPKTGDSKVYAVTRPNSPDTSYLIGSIHYIPEDLFDNTDAKIFLKYFNRCNYFIMEADIDSSKQLFEEFKVEFQIKSNREILSNTELEYVTGFLKDSLKFESPDIEKFLDTDPITAGGVLERKYVGKKFFYMDQFMRAYARHRQMKIMYLDPPDRYYYYLCQYNLLSYKDPYFKNDSLKRQYFEELYILFNDYVNNRAVDENRFSILSIQELIEKRNSEWIKIIPDLLTDKKCILLVGKGHITDLRQRLSENGFKVVPLPN
jgi:hypothetical protein